MVLGLEGRRVLGFGFCTSDTTSHFYLFCLDLGLEIGFGRVLEGFWRWWVGWEVCGKEVDWN